ncbi:MAG: HAD family hydrolase [Bacteroidota bacterium]
MKYLLFDWGDTLMVDFKQYPGPMAKWPHVEWISGAQEALETLSGTYHCYIASNSGDSDSEMIKKAFDRVNGAHFFDKIYASKNIAYEKPDSRFYQYILDDLKINANEVIMIGNDYIKDICGAKNLGISTVFLSKDKDKSKYPDADIIIDTMHKLPEALNNALLNSCK